jgi:hypothetical protein
MAGGRTQARRPMAATKQTNNEPYETKRTNEQAK